MIVLGIVAACLLATIEASKEREQSTAKIDKQSVAKKKLQLAKTGTSAAEPSRRAVRSVDSVSSGLESTGRMPVANAKVKRSTGQGDLMTAAHEKKYKLVKKKPKHKKIKMEVFEPKMKYKKIKMKIPVKKMKKKKVKGYLVKKEHHHHEY